MLLKILSCDIEIIIAARAGVNRNASAAVANGIVEGGAGNERGGGGIVNRDRDNFFSENRFNAVNRLVFSGGVDNGKGAFVSGENDI